MNRIDRVKKEITRIAWYKQAGAIRPLYIHYPWVGVGSPTLRGKSLPVRFTPTACFFADDFMEAYWPKEKLEHAARFYEQKERRHPGFVRTFYDEWQCNEVETLMRWVDVVRMSNLAAMGDTELLKLFLTISRAASRFWQESIFLDAFDVMSDRILDEARAKEGERLDDDAMAIFTGAETLSCIQCQRQGLLAIAELPKTERATMLEKHATAWHWIHNDYAIIREQDTAFFRKELRDLLADPKMMRAEKNVARDVFRMKKKKRALAKRLKVARSFVRTIDMLMTLSEWRDTRKAYTQQTNGAVARIVRELGRRTGIAQGEIEYLWVNEIALLFSSPGRARTIARKRQKGMFSFGDDPTRKTTIAFVGREATMLRACIQETFQKKSALSGRPAYRGIVRGIAKIILTQRDFHKMRRGDILVAPNTRPEYVPIMKIAGAIISEEGGLTCHTAIVSRELKIPAIVGVQGVIAALKDGDRIVVDAEKGMIRKET